jgi:cytochrome c-type biogenesis protein CcmH/NrfG
LNRENLAFLFGGFAFGVLFGYALVHAVGNQPALDAGAAQAAGMPAPAGPAAPTQTVGTSGAAGGAPMMAEINALKRRLQEDPRDAAALKRLANIYHDVAMWDQAVGYYERAVELTPDDPDLITDLGVCYRGQRQFERALEMFERAASLDAGHVQSRFNSAVVVGFDLGRYDDALEIVASLEAAAGSVPRLGELKAALEQAKSAGASGG